MSYQLLKVSFIAKAYGPKVVLDQVSLTISANDRLAIVGENGVGKTTLARIIANKELCDTGVVERKDGLVVGYLPQEVVVGSTDMSVGSFLCEGKERTANRMREIEELLAQGSLSGPYQADLLAEWNTCHEAMERVGGYDGDHRQADVLEGLGLGEVDRSIPMAQLSGGQRVRVFFAQLLLLSPDLLVLDEPTNHLDLAALECLERFLGSYPGAIIMISHDRKFLNRVVNRIVELSSRTHSLSMYTPSN